MTIKKRGKSYGRRPYEICNLVDIDRVTVEFGKIRGVVDINHPLKSRTGVARMRFVQGAIAPWSMVWLKKTTHRIRGVVVSEKVRGPIWGPHEYKNKVSTGNPRREIYRGLIHVSKVAVD